MMLESIEVGWLHDKTSIEEIEKDLKYFANEKQKKKISELQNELDIWTSRKPD